MNNQFQYERDITFKDNGLIFLENSRAILVPISSFGILRKDLYDNLGKERVKGFLIRYGSDLGRSDAKTILKKYQNLSTESIIRIGPIYHQRKGDVIANLTKLKVTKHGDKLSAYVEGTWELSYEALEHNEQFGLAKETVCHTLVGYASGFLTEVCNQTALIKETSCVGKGDKLCTFSGGTVDYWMGDIEDELKYFQEEPIVKELEFTYERLLEERNCLRHVSTINNKLTELILKEKDLPTIMNVVYELSNIPIIIEDAKLMSIASGGVSRGKLEAINQKFKSYIQSRQWKKEKFHTTKIISLDGHYRMVSPIYLKGKAIAYCSFLYEEKEEINTRFHQMLIERISSACALYILNKITESEAEQRMRGRLLEQIVNEEFTKEEILKRSSFIGLDLQQPHYIAVIQFQLSKESFKEELIFLEKLMEWTSGYFKQRGKDILIGQLRNKLVLLLLVDELKGDDIRSSCLKYLEHLSEAYHSIVFRAGISLKSGEIDNASHSYWEALTALRLATDTNQLVDFKSLGILGPLINPENLGEVERTAIDTLSPLYDFENEKCLEQLKTLYVYLLHGGNLEQTADDLMLSMSGLRYRIRRIEELLEKDLRNPKDSYQLLLSIQALISIGKLNFNAD